MCEVTANNFDQILPELKEIIDKSKFITIDVEFSCLNATEKLQNSLFDSPEERYIKLRQTVAQMIPLQIGVTGFLFNPDENSYTGHAYTFYVFPKSFLDIDTKFLGQASSFQFLTDHKFDFNKCFREGIPFLNRDQEELLNKYRSDSDISDRALSYDYKYLLKKCISDIYEWFGKAKLNDVLHLPYIDLYKANFDLKYFLHDSVRTEIKNLWTFDDDIGFKVQKVTKEEFERLSNENNLNELFISNLLGFTKVFRLLSESKKPIIGHNLLSDLLIMVDKFEQTLPGSYEKFKKLTHSLFPRIYDTKCISYDLRRLIPEEKRFSVAALETAYAYFRDGHGRHLVPKSPLIQPYKTIAEDFHCAGWDSYCTGYIFIRMAHIYASYSCNSTRKTFMTLELLEAIKKFKNSVNIIRGTLSHIQLDGSDPISTRPPWLIVENIKNKPIKINQIKSLFSTYGFVEIRPLFFKRHSAIVAVDNFGNAKRILREFRVHSMFKVQPYNILEHSPIARTVIWGSLLVSSALLAWFGFSKMKRS